MSVLVFAALGAGARLAVDTPWVKAQYAPDTSSLKAAVESVTTRQMSNDEKAIAIYDFCRLAFYHWAYPKEKGGIGPLKAVNVYGWSLCGGLHTVLGELYEEAGFKYRYRGWSKPGHTTIEVFYDGRWHYLDTFLCFYAWTRDRKTIAGQDDIIRDADVALKAKEENRGPPNILSCGDTAPGVVTGCNNSRVLGGWGGSIKQSDKGYTTDFSLGVGQSLTLLWTDRLEGVKALGHSNPHHSCGTKDFRTHPVQGPILEHYGRRTYANGLLEWRPSFKSGEFLRSLEVARNARARGGKLVPVVRGRAIQLVFRMESPYIVASASASVDFDGESPANKVTYSIDGKSWKDASDIATGVRASYRYFVKVLAGSSIKSIHLKSIIQHNRAVAPFLRHGSNKVRARCRNRAVLMRTPLVVAFGYQEATAPKGRGRFDGRGVSYGPQKNVAKVIRRSPFEFTLNVGGNTPPKMVFFKREVVAKTGGSRR